MTSPTPLAKDGRAVISGKQRLRNIRTRVRIESERQLRDFMARKIDCLPCSGDRLNDLIAAEFDRLTHCLSPTQRGET